MCNTGQWNGLIKNNIHKNTLFLMVFHALSGGQEKNTCWLLIAILKPPVSHCPAPNNVINRRLDVFTVKKKKHDRLFKYYSIFSLFNE